MGRIAWLILYVPFLLAGPTALIGWLLPQARFVTDLILALFCVAFMLGFISLRLLEAGKPVVKPKPMTPQAMKMRFASGCVTIGDLDVPPRGPSVYGMRRDNYDVVINSIQIGDVQVPTSIEMSTEQGLSDANAITEGFEVTIDSGVLAIIDPSTVPEQHCALEQLRRQLLSSVKRELDRATSDALYLKQLVREDGSIWGILVGVDDGTYRVEVSRVIGEAARWRCILKTTEMNETQD